MRLVVTGLGVVSPLGIGVETFWQAVLRGDVATREIRAFDTSGCKCRNGGEVRDFDPARAVRNIPHENLPRAAQFAVAVSRMALQDAERVGQPIDRHGLGVCVGTVLGNRPALEPRMRDPRRWPDGATRDTLLRTTSLSRAAAAELGLGGPAIVLATACAAGNSAIGFAMDTIRAGRCDAMIAGGSDELSLAMVRMFNGFGALSPDVVRPFDRHRKGLLLAEGAAAMMVESLEHARRRGARIYAEVAGHGNFADGYNMTTPHPEGMGAVRSIQGALEMSGRTADEIDYISAHGTGTPLNDSVEARAIRTVFGDAADRVPVSSIKAMLGHTQGAASAIEAVSCVLAIRDGRLPPQVNVDEPDPQCALNLVEKTSERRMVRAALNNAFGFGGNVSCLVFAQHRDERSAA